MPIKIPPCMLRSSLMNRFHSSRLPLVASLAFLTPFAAFAGPVTTVPWNGHTGAVSLTYDDARTSQIPNLLPQLDALKLKATFFICVTGAGGDFEGKKAEWIAAAKNGHELANHTKAHVNMPADPDAGTIIGEMAKYLRAVDPIVESVTFAYPGCGVNGKTGVGSEDFVARGCGQTSYAWATQPSDWMNVQGLILNPSNVATAISMFSSAKSANTWVVTIVHDVKENPDQYSMTPADNKKMLDAAVADNLWIETYQNVAAYYRAHFVMDAATASPTNAGWALTWTSPHPKMPKSVPLRVKLAAATFGPSFAVQQGGVTLAPEADGSYVIDFMKLSLIVLQKTTGMRMPAALPARLAARATPEGIRYGRVVGEVEATVVDVEGARIFRGRVADGLVPLRRDQMRGLLFLTLVDPANGNAVKALVNAIR
jgi:peptidoglycan/xylan/chitin deacetylase (PgdA/CDA1 family)